MQELQSGSNKILVVNLTKRTTSIRLITRYELELFLGGKGLGLMLYAETAKPHTPALSPQNPLLILSGSLMGTDAPNSGRFSAVTRSPLTGLMASSSCGGSFGMALKTAGYDGLILTGAASTPVYLVIHPDRVEFLDAASLWGLDTEATQQQLKPGNKDGALVIGPAGENKVLYANAVSGNRHLGRAGFGAVLGSKNVKAILAKGGFFKITPKNPEAFQKAREQANRYINRNPFSTEMYREKGTNAHILLSNLGRILPVHNFQQNHHPDAHKVSGEFFKDKYQAKPSACRPCTILCGHKGTYPDGTHQIPEYETTALFGPNLGLFDPETITRINDRCRLLGIDTISTAGTLAYWMEANQQGLVESKLHFDSAEGILETLEKIAAREGVGDDLAQGSRWLAQHYGGIEFAAQVKGLEIAAYDPRGAYGQGLAYAVSNRGGCHLSATLFPLEVYFKFLDPYRAAGKPVFVRFFEDLFNGINSIGTCVFTVYSYILESPIAKYTPKSVLAFAMNYLTKAVIPLMDVSLYSRLYSSVSGIRFSPRTFKKAGERITVFERALNTIEGISSEEDILPARFLEPSSHGGKVRTIPLERMRSMYYRLRGYDASGIPTLKTLERLQIRKQLENYAAPSLQPKTEPADIPIPEPVPERLLP
ncbi:MAG: aldehyde ferredoxin oxidoreductase family protein [Anaerolineales bacterium]|nr:aldehyde ferredoxin oxidoreductase family protein [Anaerolineales bacterium]